MKNQELKQIRKMNEKKTEQSSQIESDNNIRVTKK